MVARIFFERDELDPVWGSSISFEHDEDGTFRVGVVGVQGESVRLSRDDMFALYKALRAELGGFPPEPPAPVKPEPPEGTRWWCYLCKADYSVTGYCPTCK